MVYVDYYDFMEIIEKMILGNDFFFIIIIIIGFFCFLCMFEGLVCCL